MSKILMFNTANQHIQELEDGETDTINRLIESGWQRVEKYDLLAVYSPTLNRHKTVLKADAKTWINQGYVAEPTVVYHPEQGDKTVGSDEAQHLIDREGWYDSPAKFPKDGGVSGFVTQAAAKALDKMTKEELVAYAKSIDLTPDEALTKAQLIAAIQAASQKE
ncbi:hypothetical protein [Limnoglobus roseus]|uniref:Uncharacterized protein n=1 Tax=Limnoglobus roseus TaxID=2598579 RepID=A0A5C1AMH8_9BACT|nr:hypothetical protein [Limnoglobus roseus]QEL19337.1 hypothetical protein PX52LOC_06406 [Limnoglobus roseus]